MARWTWTAVPAALVVVGGAWIGVDAALSDVTPQLGSVVVVRIVPAPSPSPSPPDRQQASPSPTADPTDGAPPVSRVTPPPAGDDDDDDDHEDDDDADDDD